MTGVVTEAGTRVSGNGRHGSAASYRGVRQLVSALTAAATTECARATGWESGHNTRDAWDGASAVVGFCSAWVLECEGAWHCESASGIGFSRELCKCAGVCVLCMERRME